MGAPIGAARVLLIDGAEQAARIHSLLNWNAIAQTLAETPRKRRRYSYC